jgi:protein ImuB
MLWLALHLPALSLEALAATLPDDAAGAPLALLAQQRIGAVNAAAAACGVRPGLKRATALALAPSLRLGQADATRDAQALQAVLHAALAFTPMVCTDAPHATVLLEVQASLRLFGGAARLRRRLHDALAPLGHRLCWAAAPTAAGAALLARWGADGAAAAVRRPVVPAGDGRAPGGGSGAGSGGAADPIDLTGPDGPLATGPHTTDPAALQALLDEAPVWLPGPGREHWEALQGMGLRQLADLRALPRSGLARRFGEALLDALDRARGERPDPRRPVVPAAVFEAGLELFARADTTEQVLHGAARLLARLVAWAQAQQARVAAFTLRMAHERPRRMVREGDPPAHTVLRIELAEPAADAAHLQALLKERLARTTLAAPTLALALHCRDWVRAPAPNGELFPTRVGSQEGLTRLLERLRARLGDACVQALQPVADHRPEQASRCVPAATPAWPGRAPGPVAAAGAADPARGRARPATGGAAPPAGALPLHRPVWLLPEPLPLAERGALPLLEGRPLQIVAGPERIEAGWWDAPSGLATRDYFVAQAEDGALVWVYRTRLPLARGGSAASGAFGASDGPEGPGRASDGGWFLQGRFA